MTTALMLEGACLGILLAQWKLHWSSIAATFAVVLFAVSTLYSFPRHGICAGQGPYYYLWSYMWDYRQAQIAADKAKGITNIAISVHMYSIEGVGELHSDPKYWINGCAAAYYGVQSISFP